MLAKCASGDYIEKEALTLHLGSLIYLGSLNINDLPRHFTRQFELPRHLHCSLNINDLPSHFTRQFEY